MASSSPAASNIGQTVVSSLNAQSLFLIAIDPTTKI